MSNVPTTTTRSEKRMALAVSGLGSFVRLDASSARFKKEILRRGRWIHPGTGEALEFDLPLLERLARDTNRWISLGQKVHFPAGPDCHDEDARDARQNLGYWSNFRVESERLVADVEVLDEGAVPKIGKTIQDVSPEIRWPARAATGEVLDAAIFHVAATPIPAIPGQSNFERLSQLAREVSMADESSSTKANASDHGATKTLDVVAWARQRLGLPSDASVEAVLEALEQRITAAAQAPSAANEVSLAQLTREVKDARDEAEKAKKLAADLREQRLQEKRQRDEEAVQVARLASAEAGLPIPEDTCKLALSLFARNEDTAARELIAAFTARAKDRQVSAARTFDAAPSPGGDQRVSLSQEAAEKLLLERDGWIVKTRKDGSIKRDANGRPKLVRRESNKE